MFEDRKDSRWVPADEWFERNLANVVPDATEADRVPECVDEAFIERFQDKEKPSLLDERTVHVLECSYCMRRVMLARKARQERNDALRTAKHPARIAWLVAASLCLLIGGGFAFQALKPSRSAMEVRQSHPVNATVDLADAVTVRGVRNQASPLDQVVLPATLIHLSVILPQFSDPGGYSILISSDEAGTRVLARSTGKTKELSGKQLLTVDLNLGGISPGAYFLSTVRGSDQGVYYYPLRIRALTSRGL